MKSQTTIISGHVKLKRFDPGDCGGLDKDDTKKRTVRLEMRIGELQPMLYANANRSVLLILQGMDASGKDGAIRSVLREVNPAGVEVTNFKVPSAEESAHDFLWRVHKAVPRFGNIGVFNRSHYEAVLAERVLGLVPKSVWKPRYRQIVEFERMLVENGVVVVKFYLHLSREEQAKRFRERLSNPEKNWKFSHADIATRQRLVDYIGAYEDMLNATSHDAAPWHIVPADHNWYRDHVIAKTVLQEMEKLRMKWPKAKEDLSKVRFK